MKVVPMFTPHSRETMDAVTRDGRLALAYMLKKLEQNGVVYLIDSEGSINPAYLRSVYGVRTTIRRRGKTFNYKGLPC